MVHSASGSARRRGTPVTLDGTECPLLLPSRRMSHTRVPGKWQVAALFSVLTLLLTYPLSVTAHRTLPADDPDGHLFMWTLAWNTHAFVHQPLSIFDANIFFPQRNSLAFSENLIGSALFAAPVLWLTGNPVLAVNVVSLLSVVLCGLGAYVLGRRVGLSPAAAVLAGLIFAFSPPRFLRFSQIHLTVVQWIPFALASVHAYLDGGRRRDLLLATMFTTLQVLSSGHGGMFLVVAIGLMLAYRIALGEPIVLARRLRDFGIAGALLLAPSVLFAIPYRIAQGEVGLRRSLGSWDTPIESFFASPTRVDVFLMGLITDRNINGVATAWLFPGFLPLGLALAAILAGCAVIARRAPALWNVEWKPVARMVPYKLPIACLLVVALFWGAVSAARPYVGAGDGLAEQTFGKDKVVRSGFISVRRPGLYNFGMDSAGASRLSVDNLLIIDHGVHNPGAPTTGSVPLTPGAHRVLLEYVQPQRRSLDLYWTEGGKNYAPVPEWLLSRRPAAYTEAIAARALDLLRPLSAIAGALVFVWLVFSWMKRHHERWITALAPVRRNPTAFYLLLAALCVGLALGPPYGLWQFVYWLPGFSFIRGSSRFMVLGLLATAVLAGLGFDRLRARLAPGPRRAAAVVAGGLLLAEFAMIPYRGVPYRHEIPAVDLWVARQQKPFAVAEVPVTWSARYHSNYMLHSMAHWQKTVHGYSGIQPALHDLLYDQLKLFPSEDSVRHLAQLGVTYVIVHSSWFSPEERAVVEQRLPAFGSWLKLEYTDGDSRVYSIRSQSKQES